VTIKLSLMRRIVLGVDIVAFSAVRCYGRTMRR
jgi:hypothetical protein